MYIHVIEYVLNEKDVPLLLDISKSWILCLPVLYIWSFETNKVTFTIAPATTWKEFQGCSVGRRVLKREDEKARRPRQLDCVHVLWELLTLPLFVTVSDTLCQFMSFYPIKRKSSSELFYLWVYFIQLFLARWDCFYNWK